MFLDLELRQLLLVGKVQGGVRTDQLSSFLAKSMPPPGLMLLELAVTDSHVCFRCCNEITSLAKASKPLSW